MVVENSVIEKWKSYREYGDTKAICKQYGVDRNQVYNAFKTGEMSEEVFEAINSFYAERHKRVTDSTNLLK
jgi:hypothetical protein